MYRYITTDADGRISATWENPKYGTGDLEFDFPVDFDFTRQQDWRLVDGALAHDPLPAEPPQAPSLQERMEAVEAALLEMILGGTADG